MKEQLKVYLGLLVYVLLILGMCVFLNGCDDEDKNAGVRDITQYYKMEGNLENCTVNRLTSRKTYSDLTVVYCDGKPSMSVRVPSGKTSVTHIIINGVEYDATPSKKEQQ